MSWTVILPFKGLAERKTRLAGRLSAVDRNSLSLTLFDHAVRVLERCSSVGHIAALSDVRPARWQHQFLPDSGRGLNEELSAAVVGLRARGGVLILLPDLPLLAETDVDAMVAGLVGVGRTGYACAYSIAPDRSGTGTNALALVEPRDFKFAFGPDSCAAHLQACRRPARVVARPGLALDIDTGADLDDAVALGFRPSEPYNPQPPIPRQYSPRQTADHRAPRFGSH